MTNVVIKVEGLGKKYVIGHQGKGGYKTFREQIGDNLKTVFSKTKKMLSGQMLVEGEEMEEFWALKDVSFELKQGETLGIIGRNGAGKSTLLKILSRITEPTTGKVILKGRVASLLEVGTGFHPELSGRENIFLNGAILGMRRAEIKRKFDEIVDFSGVEKFLDTPVKRYSSGMYVRLAFSVAAHLEPEILIVDEVLAVGDAEFQKKCLGKMKDVSEGGRTVLFVSHNMTAMNTLADRGIFMQNGVIIETGSIGNVITRYLSSDSGVSTKKSWQTNPVGDDAVQLLDARLVNEMGDDADAIDFYKGGGIEYTYQILKEGFYPVPNMYIHNQKGDFIMAVAEDEKNSFHEIGIYKTTMLLPPNLLNDGRYISSIAASTMVPEVIHFLEKEAIVFDVIEDMNLRNIGYRGPIPGIIRPNLTWKTIKINN